LLVTPSPQKEKPKEESDWRDWKFQYNRRLAVFSHCVSNLAFSLDGRWFISALASGDLKVWHTATWAEAGRPQRGAIREESKALSVSPKRSWLVSLSPSVVQIFRCEPPWNLVYSLKTEADPVTQESSKWCCMDFSPAAEVETSTGKTGQDNHMAVLGSQHLTILEYSGGFGPDTPRRTQSLGEANPTGVSYTPDGCWLVVGFASGQMHIWNGYSLTLHRAVCAHNGIVNDLKASPRNAPYDQRLISCGVDHALRVWHTRTWVMEQNCTDARSDRFGVRGCSFSETGSWLVSIANDVCVWRVHENDQKNVILSIHQRLESSSVGPEGISAAAFCGNRDAIAIGSREGMLSLWTLTKGQPPSPKEAAAAPAPSEVGQGLQGLRNLAAMPQDTKRSTQAGRIDPNPWRPMQRLTEEGIKPPPRPVMARVANSLTAQSTLRPMRPPTTAAAAATLALRTTMTNVGNNWNQKDAARSFSTGTLVETDVARSTMHEDWKMKAQVRSLSSTALAGPERMLNRTGQLAATLQLAPTESEWQRKTQMQRFSPNALMGPENGRGSCANAHSLTVARDVGSEALKELRSMNRTHVLLRNRCLVERISLQPQAIAESKDQT